MGDDLTLLCFPYAGGSSLAYSAWSRFDPEVEVVAVDYPGHLLRPHEKLSRSMDDLVARLVPEIRERWDRRFVLMGASLGGLVAFELARVAEAAGTPPAAVVVASSPAPSQLVKHPPIAGLDDAAFLDAMVERYGGLDQQLLGEPGAVELLMPMVRADMELFEDYASWSHEPISSDVLAVGGREDRAAPLEDVEAWQGFSSGEVEIAAVAGGHFFVEAQPEVMMEMLRARLAAARG